MVFETWELGIGKLVIGKAVVGKAVIRVTNSQSTNLPSPDPHSPNLLQEFQLLYRLKASAAFVLVIRIDLDFLFSGPMIVSGEHRRGRANLVHQTHGE